MLNNTKGDAQIMLGIDQTKNKQIPEELTKTVNRFEELMAQYGRRNGISSEGLAILIVLTEMVTGKNIKQMAKEFSAEKEPQPEQKQEKKDAIFSEAMSLEELKEACRNRQLKDYGTKAELVKRLQEHELKVETAAA